MENPYIDDTYITFLEWWENEKTHAVLGFVNGKKVWAVLGKDNPDREEIKAISEALLALNKGYMK